MSTLEIKLQQIKIQNISVIISVLENVIHTLWKRKVKKLKKKLIFAEWLFCAMLEDGQAKVNNSDNISFIYMYAHTVLWIKQIPSFAHAVYSQ